MLIDLVRFGLVIAAATLLASCGVELPHSVSLADRCGDVMRLAMPTAEIEIDKRSSHDVDMTRIIARAAGVRTDLPEKAPMPREVAAECEFQDSILTAFHWTKGGPQRLPHP